jgi:hypothetical protein
MQAKRSPAWLSSIGFRPGHLPFLNAGVQDPWRKEPGSRIAPLALISASRGSLFILPPSKPTQSENSDLKQIISIEIFKFPTALHAGFTTLISHVLHFRSFSFEINTGISLMLQS